MERKSELERERKENKIHNFIKGNYWRVLICTVLCASVFVMPLLTESRYRAYLNGFAAIIAKEYYFSSNYMKEDGAFYAINGWNGSEIPVGQLEIRNYDNTLLSNQTGQDLKYKLTWTVTVYDDKGQEVSPYDENGQLVKGYKLEFEKNEENSNSNPLVNDVPDDTLTDMSTKKEGVTGTIIGKMIGNGTSQRDVFDMKLTPIDPANILPNKGYVNISLRAENKTDSGTNSGAESGRNQYSRTITANLRYTVSQLENFINQFEITETKESIETTLQTNVIPGVGTTQEVRMWWDLSKLDANRYNYLFNQLFMAGNYSIEKVGERQFGVLRIPAASLSSNVFQFVKLDESLKFITDNTTDTYNYVLAGSYKNAGANHYLGYYMETSTSGGTGDESTN